MFEVQCWFSFCNKIFQRRFVGTRKSNIWYNSRVKRMVVPTTREIEEPDDDPQMPILYCIEDTGY